MGWQRRPHVIPLVCSLICAHGVLAALITLTEHTWHLMGIVSLPLAEVSPCYPSAGRPPLPWPEGRDRDPGHNCSSDWWRWLPLAPWGLYTLILALACCHASRAVLGIVCVVQNKAPWMLPGLAGSQGVGCFSWISLISVASQSKLSLSVLSWDLLGATDGAWVRLVAIFHSFSQWLL